MECVIKNRNVEVAYFDSDKELNKITYFVFLNKDKAPLYLQRGGDLVSWLKSRVSAEYRGSVNDILNRLLKTHGVSLTDTFYIKCDFVSCGWDSINPYSGRLTDVSSIGEEVDNENTLADGTLGGSFKKRWVSDCGIPSILKYGTGRFASNSDNEPECEYKAYTLAHYLDMNVAEYDFLMIEGSPATICPSFCSESIGMVTLYELGYEPHSYSELYQIAVDNKWDEYYVADMALLDFLTINIDRHLENIGLYVRNATQTVIGFTPMYDFNMALLPYYVPNDMSVDEYLKKNEYSKSYLGEEWVKVARWLKELGLVDSKIALAKKFSYHGNIGSCVRCDIANEALKNRLHLLESCR